MKDLVKVATRKVSRKLFGVADPRLVTKQVHTNIRKKLYREKFGTGKLLNFLDDLGIKRGDTIFVPSSWGEFYNFQGDVIELISALNEIIGPNGNLAMPSNTSLFTDNQTFNVKKTPTNSGIIAEFFRRTKGVKRSIHLNSSVCVFGPDAELITSGHENSITPWDEFSPHYKLYKMNAKILALGCGSYFSMGTPWHCVDSHLFRSNDYFKEIYSKKITYNWIDEYKSQGKGISCIRDKESNLRFINKYIRSVPHINGKLSNLKAYVVNIEPLVNKGIELAEEGITLYGKY